MGRGKKVEHGKSNTKTYIKWASMKQRCNNASNANYRNYGGRGIEICERWLKFENFYNDMGDPPTEKHTLGRIDNNKGYFPGNCRWETMKQQQNNKRGNRIIEFNGKIKTVSQWAEFLGINPTELSHRLVNDTKDIALSPVYVTRCKRERIRKILEVEKRIGDLKPDSRYCYNDVNIAIGKRIADKREEFGISQKDFAKAIGISRTALANIEIAFIRVNIDRLKLIARGLEVTTDYILFGDE